MSRNIFMTILSGGRQSQLNLSLISQLTLAMSMHAKYISPLPMRLFITSPDLRHYGLEPDVEWNALRLSESQKWKSYYYYEHTGRSESAHGSYLERSTGTVFIM